MPVGLKPQTLNYGHGVFAQIEKSVIVPLGVSDFLKSSLVLFLIKNREPKPKKNEAIKKNNNSIGSNRNK